MVHLRLFYIFYILYHARVWKSRRGERFDEICKFLPLEGGVVWEYLRIFVKFADWGLQDRFRNGTMRYKFLIYFAEG